MTGNGTVNFAADIVSAAGTVGVETTAASPLYIYESGAGATSVIVKGTYNGTTGYYRLAFKSNVDGSILAVARNKHYKFEITSVNGIGYVDFDDAAAATASNATITATVSVIDLSSHDIIDNGEYYLGVSNSELIVFSDGALTGSAAVTVSTDAMAKDITLNEVTTSAGLTVSPTTYG